MFDMAPDCKLQIIWASPECDAHELSPVSRTQGGQSSERCLNYLKGESESESEVWGQIPN